MYIDINKILIELRCKQCSKHFLYCRKSGPDFRCKLCKNGQTLEDVEKELAEMDHEEYQSFMDDIKEYEDELEEKRASRMDRKKNCQK